MPAKEIDKEVKRTNIRMLMERGEQNKESNVWYEWEIKQRYRNLGNG